MFVTAETVERVRQLREEGLRTIEIAHRLGVAQSTVHYHLRRLLDPPPPPPRRQPGPPPADHRSAVTTRERVAELLETGLSRAEVAKRLGLTKSTVSYHARRLGEPIDDRCRATVRLAGSASLLRRGLLASRRVSSRVFGFSKRLLGRRRAGVARSSDPAEPPTARRGLRWPTRHRSRGHLKQRLLTAGLKRDECERVRHRGLVWGTRCTMSLHHMNGDRTGQPLENLEFLCPNCHAQTATFSGRNGRQAGSSGLTERPTAQPGLTAQVAALVGQGAGAPALAPSVMNRFAASSSLSSRSTDSAAVTLPSST